MLIHRGQQKENLKKFRNVNGHTTKMNFAYLAVFLEFVEINFWVDDIHLEDIRTVWKMEASTFSKSASSPSLAKFL